MSSSDRIWAAFPAATVLAGALLFIRGATLSPDRASADPVRWRPLRSRVLPQPTLRPPGYGTHGSTVAPSLAAIRWSERWPDRRALMSAGEAVRAYGIGDEVGTDLLVAIESDAVRVMRQGRILRLTPGGEAALVEDFRERPQSLGKRLPPADPELESAVYATLELLRADPGSAQLGFDALIDAGEAIVPYLVRRATSLATIAGWPLRLPDGRRLAPRREGVAVQAALEAITGQRFGDVLDPEAGDEAVLDAGVAWASWLGL